MNTTPILVRLPKGADLLLTLNALCKEKNITRGSVQVIGALEAAGLGYYLQDEKRYENHTVNEHMEILCGIGNISLKDGVPFVHMHLTLSKRDLSVIGGHTTPGNIIFAAEALITPVPGETLVREVDEATGLPLWV